MTLIEVLLITKCGYYCVHLIWMIFKYLTATDTVYDEHGNRAPNLYQYLEPLNKRLWKSFLCLYLMVSDVIVTISIPRTWYNPFTIGCAAVYAVVTTVVLFVMITSKMDMNIREYKFEHAVSLEEFPDIHTPIGKVVKGTLGIFIFWFVQIMICGYYIQ